MNNKDIESIKTSIESMAEKILEEMVGGQLVVYKLKCVTTDYNIIVQFDGDGEPSDS